MVCLLCTLVEAGGALWRRLSHGFAGRGRRENSVKNSVKQAMHARPVRDLPQPRYGGLCGVVLQGTAIGDQAQRLGRDLLARQDRKSVVEGKRVDIGGRRILKKKRTRT